LGDATRAKVQLGWQPKVSFEDLVKEMVDGDMQIAKRDAMVASQGYRVYHYRD
jgi:GDPmannose 4,6-dehydratase